MTFSLLHNVSARDALFELRTTPVSLKAVDKAKPLYLSIRPEQVRTLALSDSKSSDGDVPFPDEALSLGSTVACLGFTLDTPAALIGPKTDTDNLIPITKPSGLILDQLRSLVRETCFTIYLAYGGVFTKTRLQQLCDAIAFDGGLKSSSKALNTADIYHGHGGKVWNGGTKTSTEGEAEAEAKAEAEGTKQQQHHDDNDHHLRRHNKRAAAASSPARTDSPPSYDELALSPPPPPASHGTPHSTSLFGRACVHNFFFFLLFHCGRCMFLRFIARTLSRIFIWDLPAPPRLLFHRRPRLLDKLDEKTVLIKFDLINVDGPTYYYSNNKKRQRFMPTDASSKPPQPLGSTAGEWVHINAVVGILQDQAAKFEQRITALERQQRKTTDLDLAEVKQYVDEKYGELESRLGQQMEATHEGWDEGLEEVKAEMAGVVEDQRLGIKIDLEEFVEDAMGEAQQGMQIGLKELVEEEIREALPAIREDVFEFIKSRISVSMAFDDKDEET